MLFVIAFAVLLCAFAALSWYEKRQKLQHQTTEQDLYAIKDGAAFGNAIGQAQMAKMGIEADEITQREDTEFKKFKFD